MRVPRPTIMKLCRVCGLVAETSQKMRPSGNLSAEVSCRKCRAKYNRDQTRQRLGLSSESKIIDTRAIDGERSRVCTKCKVLKQPDEFTHYIGSNGRKRWIGSCRECKNVARLQRHQKQKHTSYLCVSCETAQVTRKGRGCRDCYLKVKASERQKYIDSIGGLRRQRRATPPRVIKPQPQAPWSLGHRCVQCGKPILYQTKCYACAT